MSGPRLPLVSPDAALGVICCYELGLPYPQVCPTSALSGVTGDKGAKGSGKIHVLQTDRRILTLVSFHFTFTHFYSFTDPNVEPQTPTRTPTTSSFETPKLESSFYDPRVTWNTADPYASSPELVKFPPRFDLASPSPQRGMCKAFRLLYSNISFRLSTSRAFSTCVLTFDRPIARG